MGPSKAFATLAVARVHAAAWVAANDRYYANLWANRILQREADHDSMYLSDAEWAALYPDAYQRSRADVIFDERLSRAVLLLIPTFPVLTLLDEEIRDRQARDDTHDVAVYNRLMRAVGHFREAFDSGSLDRAHTIIVYVAGMCEYEFKPFTFYYVHIARAVCALLLRRLNEVVPILDLPLPVAPSPALTAPVASI